MPNKKVPARIGPPTKTGRSVPKHRTDLRSNNAARMIALRKTKIVRDAKGNIVKGSVLSHKDKNPTGGVHRIAPDRRWFGATRVISQNVLQQFRDEMKAAHHDPYAVVVNYAKLPTQLLNEPKHDDNLAPKNKIEFTKTFGKSEGNGKVQARKRPKLQVNEMAAMVAAAMQKTEAYEQKAANTSPNGLANDRQTIKEQEKAVMDDRNIRPADALRAGQSHRIWGELYKVIDSSDVVLQVLDARDPMGSRCKAVEKYLRTEKKYKHLIFVLNKCDLIPTWVTKKWVAILSKEFPTIAFHASVTNPFGKGNLISLIRQFSRLHKNNNKRMMSVGLIGYPNVGKSSVINALRGKKVCKVAPVPGETKVWQYVALTKQVYLIDCPGVIHHNEANDSTDSVLKSVVRVEKLGGESLCEHVAKVLELVDRQKMIDTYGVEDWDGFHEFLDAVATKRGKLLPGGVPDREAAARSVLYDWQRGKIPWFRPPPISPEEAERAKAEEEEEKAAKGTKRPRDDDEESGDESGDDGDEDVEVDDEAPVVETIAIKPKIGKHPQTPAPKAASKAAPKAAPKAGGKKPAPKKQKEAAKAQPQKKKQKR